MKNRNLRLSTLLLFLFSTASAQKIISLDKVSNHSFRIYADDFGGAVFNETYTNNWIDLKRDAGKIYGLDTIALLPARMAKFKRYTPTKEDIETAEQLLRANLKRLFNRLPDVPYVNGPNVYRNLKNYFRQYFGFKADNGEKIILINGFWIKNQKQESEWFDEYYKIFDGGNYYWNAKANITAGKLFDFGVNGAI